MRCGRAFGNRRRTPPALGIDLFIEDGAYTTLASAVSLLVVLTLVFSAATATWTLSRAGEVQTSADITALAGANVVSSYHTAATVIDASILSLSLTGLCTVGVGMAGLLIPGVNVAAGETIQVGIRILEARNKFATSASKGLQTLEKSLPYLIAANATRACLAQNTDTVSYTGTALAVPFDSASEFSALAEEQISTDGLEASAQNLDEAADELAQAAEKTAQARERAWLADCGREGMNMQERAGKLSGISSVQNPDYASSITWNPSVGIARAQAYYQWRRDHDSATASNVEARADAAARHAYYQFAAEELSAAYFSETEGTVSYYLLLLPKNMTEVKRTRLYTDAMWPSSQEASGLTLHFDASCPGATGARGSTLALSAIDSGAAHECGVCHLSVGDVGKTPQASTAIDNGFEYHLREFTLALEEYVSARQDELALENQAKGAAEQAGDSFEEALSVLSSTRPRIAPPGRNGCIALVSSSAIRSPESLNTAFSKASEIGARGAISAAVLAPDAATADNNVLGEFFSTLETSSGSTIVSLVGDVMDLWGQLLCAYGDLSAGLEELMDGLLGDFSALGAGPIATWLGDRVKGALSALGFEPVDLSFRKPVLTDSSNVLQSSDMTGLATLQESLRSIPLATTDPADILQALGYSAGEYLTSSQFSVAEISLPGGTSIPLTIQLSDFTGDS